MKKTIFLSPIMVLTALALLTSCDPGKDSSKNEPTLEDSTRFSSSSIVGIWACIASDHLMIDILTQERSYNWDYDPNAETYDVYWYFDIKSDSKVHYVNVWDEEMKGGEYRKSDKCLHIPANSEWDTLIEADYIFDQNRQAIRCPSGNFLGFTLESTETLLGNDTIFFVKRKAIDEAVIFDNTGWIQSQYVIRVKEIKKDL